jgi:hypothetical protein
MTQQLHYSNPLVSFQDTHRLISDALCSKNDSQRSFASHFCGLGGCHCISDDRFLTSVDARRLFHVPQRSLIGYP